MAMEEHRYMDLRAGPWSELTIKLVEHMLSFVPVRDLCKSWDLLDRVQKRLKDRKITLKVTESAIQLLGSLGYDPNYGAHPVKRVIQQSIENELARSILKGDFKEEDTILVDTDLTSVAGSGLPQQKLSFRKLLPGESSNQAAGADPFAYAQGQN